MRVRRIRKIRVLIGTLLVLAVSVAALTASPAPASAAGENAFATYISGPQESILKSQAAYTPDRLIPVNTTGAEDIFLDGDTLYVADTTGKAVIEMTTDGTVLRRLGLDESGTADGTFEAPNGLAVKDGVLYVADKGRRAVVRVDLASGEVIDTVERPDSPLYGASTPYVPLKIAVDDAHNMYVVGEGNPNGVIHLSHEGVFEGYLGANKTPVTFMSILQNIFFTEEQKQQFLTRTPPSPSAVALDDRGLLYTVTPGDVSGAIKRLNTSGVSITETAESYQSQAVAVDGDYNMYEVSSDGYITLFTESGRMLFRFGGENTLDRFGRLVNPVSIKVDESLNIYVLDKTVGAVVRYAPTAFYRKVHEALGLYQDGYYLEAEPLWEEVLKDNANFIIGYASLARSSLKHEDYSLALERFRIAEDRAGYSDAFWQIRNIWLQNNILWLIVAVAAFVVVVAVLRQIHRRTALLAPVVAFFGKVRRVRILDQVLYAGHFMRHPIQSIEQMRYKHRIGVGAALVLYALYVLVGVIGLFTQGFIWTGARYNVNVLQFILTMLLPLLLGVVCNYFVASITDGAGKFSHVFIAAIYSFTPYILFYPVFIILTNILTMNEMVILQFVNLFIIFYCTILLLLSIYQVHYYKFGGVVKNVLLTAFCFAMVVLFAVIIYLLVMQQFGFWESIIWEVFS